MTPYTTPAGRDGGRRGAGRSFPKERAMRQVFAATVLGGFILAAGLSPAGDKKGEGGGGAHLHFPISGKDAEWFFKGGKPANWAVGNATMDEKNQGQLDFVAKKGKGAELVNKKGGGVDIYSEEKYGDCTIEVEFMIPKGSNSGVYVMGEYEVQVFDSYGKASDKLNQGDLGAIYSAAAPKVNAAKKPGEWQKFVIDFQAPRFADNKRTQMAKFIKVELNGQVIHENVEVKGSTGGALTGKEAATGPLMFQGDHGAVSFRNIKITARK